MLALILFEIVRFDAVRRLPAEHQSQGKYDVCICDEPFGVGCASVWLARHSRCVPMPLRLRVRQRQASARQARIISCSVGGSHWHAIESTIQFGRELKRYKSRVHSFHVSFGVTLSRALNKILICFSRETSRRYKRTLR